MTDLACIEVGASGCQTVVLHADGLAVVTAGAHAPVGLPLVMASPGLIAGTRVLAASNLDWWDVDPLEVLGVSGTLSLLRNDAEAAALGEWALRGAVDDLVFVGLGTGVGGAVITGGTVTANLFGHLDGYSDIPCPCGRTGCLETVAAGWAIDDPISDPGAIATAVAHAILRTPEATAERVVLAGGITRRHPELVDRLRAELPGRRVEASLAPPEAKSAAAWGLAHEFARLAVDAA